METQNSNTIENNKNYSEKEFTNMLVDCIDAECLQLCIEDRERQQKECEISKNKYLFFHHFFIAFVLLTIASIFATSTITWFVFPIGSFISYHLYSKRWFWKNSYEFDCGLFNYSELLIKEAKFNLYGIK